MQIGQTIWSAGSSIYGVTKTEYTVMSVGTKYVQLKGEPHYKVRLADMRLIKQDGQVVCQVFASKQEYNDHQHRAQAAKALPTLLAKIVWSIPMEDLVVIGHLVSREEVRKLQTKER